MNDQNMKTNDSLMTYRPTDRHNDIRKNDIETTHMMTDMMT